MSVTISSKDSFKHTPTLLNDLESYWKFEEGSGTLTNATGNTNLNLTSTGNLNYQATGKIDYGVNFDQTLAYACATTTNTGLYFRDFYDKFTFSIWVRFNATASSDGRNHALISYPKNSSPYHAIMLRVTSANNYVEFKIYNSDYVAYAGSTISSVTIAADTWYHIVCVANGIGAYPKVYINGTGYTCTGNTQSTVPAVGDSGFTIGNSYSAGTQGSNAIIDEVGYWTRVLTDAEITALYNSGSCLQHPFSSQS